MIGKKYMVAKYKKGKDIGEVLDQVYMILFEPEIGNGVILFDSDGKGFHTSPVVSLVTTKSYDGFSLEINTMNSTYVLCEVR